MQTTYEIELQPKKARSPIDAIDEGIVIDVKNLQPEKAKLPIDVTVSGMEYSAFNPQGYSINSFFSELNRMPSMEVKFSLSSSTLIETRFEQYSKGADPIEVTEEGMVTEVRDEQSLKA